MAFSFSLSILIIIFSKIIFCILNLTLLLDLLLEQDVIGSSLLQSVTQILRDDNIDHVDLLEIDTVLVESEVKVTFEG